MFTTGCVLCSKLALFSRSLEPDLAVTYFRIPELRMMNFDCAGVPVSAVVHGLVWALIIHQSKLLFWIAHLCLFVTQ